MEPFEVGRVRCEECGAIFSLTPSENPERVSDVLIDHIVTCQGGPESNPQLAEGR